MVNRLRLFMLIVLASLAISACGAFGASPTPFISEGQLATAATQQAQASDSPIPVEPPDSSTLLLPHSLYFLSSEDSGVVQVWRVGADGESRIQITAETNSVIDFDVSPVDGKLAYVVGNQIYLLEADGSGRRLLVDGGPVEQDSSEYHFRSKVGQPRWSPDGETLAFAQNGVNLYQMGDGSISHLLTNQLDTIGDELLPAGLYFPGRWSPDGSRLLVEVGYFEGGGLAVLDPSTGNLVDLGEGIVCCHPVWAPDGGSVVVASPFLGLIESGLWRYSAQSGDRTVLIPANADDGTLNFAGWPLQTPEGQLYYFYTNLPAFPESDAPLALVRSQSDGVTDRQQLRPDLMLVAEALWAPDGSLAVVVQPPPGEPQQPLRGPIVVVRTDQSPILPLGVNGYSLRWGP